MYCPECGAEFREGITECYDCEVPLGPEPPDEPAVEKYVTVLETSELSAVPIMKTALEAAEIPFRTRGEGLMRLFPSNALGAPLHESGGEIKIRVPESRAEEARQLLESEAVIQDGAGNDETGEDEDGEPAESA